MYENDKTKIETDKLTYLRQSKMERKVRQTGMWLKRLKGFLRFLMTIFLLFCVYIIVKLPQWYLSPNAFNSVKSPYLEIVNNKIVPDYHILAQLRKFEIPHIPIYLMDTTEMKQNILQLEPVEDVFIRRFWFPARLQIIVKERKPIITIAPAEDVAPVAFIAEGGKLISRDYLPLPTVFKTYLVLTYGARGDDYRNWNKAKIDLIVKLGKTIEENAKEPIEYIDLRNPNDVYVKLKTVNLRLGVLDDSLFERIKRIASILPQIKTLDKKIKYVDLRWKNANYIKLDE